MKKRNEVIELLRFLFCIGIWMFHARAFLTGESEALSAHFFTNGAFGVQFFFILSGFFMAAAARKERDSTASVGKRAFVYTLKKYKAVFPCHMVAVVFCLFFTFATNGTSLKNVLKTLFDGIYSVLLLDMGISNTLVNGYEWYISAMLIAGLVWYALLLKNFETTALVLAPTAALLGCGYILHQTGELTYISYWMGHMYKGLLNAFSVLPIGILAFMLCEKLRQGAYTRCGKWLFTAVECGSYALAFWYILSPWDGVYAFLLLPFLMTAVAFTLSGVTYTACPAQVRFFGFLGKMSLPIYLSQYFAYIVTGRFCAAFSFEKRLSVYILITLALAFVCLGVSQLWKRLSQNAKGIILKKKDA